MTHPSVFYCFLLPMLASSVALGAPAAITQCQQCHSEGSASTERSAALTSLNKTDFTKKLQAYQQQVIPDSIMSKSAHRLSAKQIEELADYYQDLKSH